MIELVGYLDEDIYSNPNATTKCKSHLNCDYFTVNEFMTVLSDFRFIVDNSTECDKYSIDMYFWDVVKKNYSLLVDKKTFSARDNSCGLSMRSVIEKAKE